MASEIKARKKPPVSDALDPAMTKAQVAEALVISVRKLEQMVSAGHFPRPHIYPGMDTSPRWRVSEVNEWLRGADGKE